jgi:hypothetical protein
MKQFQPARTIEDPTKLPYDNTALRERMREAEIASRSVVAELHAAARSTTRHDAPSHPLSDRRWRKAKESFRRFADGMLG